jgi:hypothetical protein
MIPDPKKVVSSVRIIKQYGKCTGNSCDDCIINEHRHTANRVCGISDSIAIDIAKDYLKQFNPDDLPMGDILEELI